MTEKALSFLQSRFTLIFLIIIPAALFVFYPLTDPDIFWHLQAGKEVLSRRAFLFTDPFSFTNPGSAWIDLHWLFQCIVYIMHSLGGNAGLLIFKSLLFGSSAALLFFSVKTRGNQLLVLPLLLIAVFEYRYLVTMRPVLFTLFFLALFFCSLERYTSTGKLRFIITLPVIQVLWVNSQGLFALGVIVSLCYAAGELLSILINAKFPGTFSGKSSLNTKGLTILAALPLLLILVSIINPYGIKGLIFSLELFRRIDPSISNIYSQNIVENTPLLLMLGTGYARYVYFFLFISAIAVFSLIASSRHIRFAHLFTVVAFLVPAYMAQRNIILYVFALIPLLKWNFGHWNPGKKGMGLAAAFGLFMAVWVVFSGAGHLRMLLSCQELIAPFSNPAGSVEYLNRVRPDGNLFNADRYGGYVIWKTEPCRQVFIDTRLTIRNREFFAGYLEMLNSPELFYKTAAEYDIRQVMIPAGNNTRYHNLARQLYRDSLWNLLYTDGSEALFIHASQSGSELDLGSGAVMDSLKKALSDRYRTADLRQEALFHLGGFLAALGEYESAENVLKGSEKPENLILEAKVKMLGGKIPEAVIALEKLVSKKPYKAALLLLASIYKQQGNDAMAGRYLKRVLIQDPFNKDAGKILNVKRDKNAY